MMNDETVEVNRGDYTRELLRTTLATAVPLWQLEYEQRPLAVLIAMAGDKAQDIAEHGDVILYRGKKKGESAAAFNSLAQSIAILSFMPGGITFLGDHYERTHPDQTTKR